MLYAAYLGGEMVFTKGTGVNHTAWEAASEDYEAVLPFEKVTENTLFRVTASGVPVVLLRQGEQVYAISATCPHAGDPLAEGSLQGDVVEFDRKTIRGSLNFMLAHEQWRRIALLAPPTENRLGLA